MTDIQIRPATAQDTDALIALIDIASNGFVNSLFAEATPDGMTVTAFIAARMHDTSSGLSFSKMWVADIGRQVAGFIALDHTPHTATPITDDIPPMFRPLTALENLAPDCCLINLVATFPQFRGQKAGYALLEFAETRRGKNGMCLTVGDTNHAAQAFYERLNYRVTAQRPVVKENWDTAYNSWLLMVKDDHFLPQDGRPAA
jgi:ribosomal protein S18 acetylase RimI-like enzyme